MKNYDVIIIGGGASGCMATHFCKQNNIAIIDSNTKLAKKVLATGNGRCNLTNKNINSTFYNQNIDKYLCKFNQDQTLEFFENLGLETYFDEEGRCYPISNSAKSVVDVLVRNLDKKADVFLGESVLDIKVDCRNGNKIFTVKTDKDIYLCQKLVVACGGNSLLQNINKLGVKTKEFSPSLVSLNSKDIKDLAGIKVSNVLVKLTDSLGITKSEVGEVLFKDGGISGIVIFNLSAILARNANYKAQIEIDLLPNISLENLVCKLNSRKSLNVSMDKFFVGFFQNALANEVFKQARQNTNINCNKLTDKEIVNLARTIKGLKFSVNGASNNNQVYSGGVLLSALDGNLMSKNVPNLYFCGEVCDVDGVCGGYNLQWAWTSGKIVGESL